MATKLVDALRAADFYKIQRYGAVFGWRDLIGANIALLDVGPLPQRLGSAVGEVLKYEDLYEDTQYRLVYCNDDNWFETKPMTVTKVCSVLVALAVS